MASYNLKTIQTEIAHNTTTRYMTDTDLLVASGHAYHLKSVEIFWKMTMPSIAGSISGALHWEISDSAGANFKNVSKAIAPASSTSEQNGIYQFAKPTVEIVTAMPATMSVASVTAPDTGEENNLYNRRLGAGQILRFSPDSVVGSGVGIGSGGGDTNTIIASLRVVYIDYTE